MHGLQLQILELIKVPLYMYGSWFHFFFRFRSCFLSSFEAIIEFRGIGKGVDPLDRRVPGVIFSSFHSAW